MYVRPKKSLGQHFLHDRNIAAKIVNSLRAENVNAVLEIGPGTGILTGLLLQRQDIRLFAVEVDRESIAHLREQYPQLESRILEQDILELDPSRLGDGSLSVIGNFPYYISSQIFFWVLAHRDQVEEVVCMIQQEVARRIAGGPGSKTYGILSVLLQTFYSIDYLFPVGAAVFTPPPKVQSAVIRLRRNERRALPCREDLYFRLVKTAFNQRRKTLRNAIKSILLPLQADHPLLQKRAEQLGVDEFIALTCWVEENQKT